MLRGDRGGIKPAARAFGRVGAASCLDFPAIAAHMRCIPPGPAKRLSSRLWGAPAE